MKKFFLSGLFLCCLQFITFAQSEEQNLLPFTQQTADHHIERIAELFRQKLSLTPEQTQKVHATMLACIEQAQKQPYPMLDKLMEKMTDERKQKLQESVNKKLAETPEEEKQKMILSAANLYLLEELKNILTYNQYMDYTEDISLHEALTEQPDQHH